MNGRELREIAAEIPPDTEVGIWMWFADGERIYLPNKPMTGVQYREDRERGPVAIMGTCDDCPAHTLEKV